MKEKNFIDFILDASESQKLTRAFLGAKSKVALKQYFEKSPYAVSTKELDKIWKIKTKLPDVPPWGPGPSPMY
jgi:hypothetical protein